MPTAPLKPEEARALKSAAAALNAGRAQDAAAQVKPLIATGSRHPDLLMLYSAACERLGNAREALGACNAAVHAAPDRADAWAGLGRLLHEQGQSAQGAEMLERAVQLDAGKAEYWYNLGLAADGGGKRERALEALATAARLSPAWAMPWAMLGQVHLAQNALAEAETALRKALALDSR
jgi:tetratricopeptide (TPR) repeat protein